MCLPWCSAISEKPAAERESGMPGLTVKGQYQEIRSLPCSPAPSSPASSQWSLWRKGPSLRSHCILRGHRSVPPAHWPWCNCPQIRVSPSHIQSLLPMGEACSCGPSPSACEAQVDSAGEPSVRAWRQAQRGTEGASAKVCVQKVEQSSACLPERLEGNLALHQAYGHCFLSERCWASSPARPCPHALPSLASRFPFACWDGRASPPACGCKLSGWCRGVRKAGTNSFRGHLGAFLGFSSRCREKCPCLSGINWYRPWAVQVLLWWGGGKGLSALLWIQSSQPRSGSFLPHPVGLLLLLLPVCTLPPSFTLFLSLNATLQKGRPGEPEVHRGGGGGRSSPMLFLCEWNGEAERQWRSVLIAAWIKKEYVKKAPKIRTKQTRKKGEEKEEEVAGGSPLGWVKNRFESCLCSQGLKHEWEQLPSHDGERRRFRLWE